ncbi:flagellar basal-body MS-ring/collar protein FliF [Jannaschia sp. W003]|uniref:flagellar basal-body MS-ring/collar protein FliF n=1 Tax=Jannaschia sp. W003 TaxID=2867012 RepID=UPI0021A56BA6|nr:flagellar basal-body MS-ring/collar protein FliF [Jannaschia sp. W003]UWQ21821.1 flagellar M-ring protein FliF [Jannaschia sp. W003]
MQTLIDDIKARRLRRPAILAGATLATFALVLALARMASEPVLELLYARLDPAVASGILSELEARGVAHELRGDSIWVDAAQRDRLRLDLAAEGLPGGDGAGYELLDTLSGFGTTSQMFDAALLRAREGELARTLLAGRGVEAARVHVAASNRSPFARERAATASVTLRMRSGDVPADLAEAAQTLVAGAVAGLAPGDVSVMDARSGRVVSREAGPNPNARRAERLHEMRAAIDRILAARVGPGRFVAEVNLETSLAEETMRERTLDPSGRVAISTETEESTASGTAAGGGVTVASNLPDGDAGAEGGGESRSADSRERVNYEVSERERQVVRGAGAVERISVAVLVDGTYAPTEGGAEPDWTPRPDEELATIAELVQSAVGFREDRGDVVTVRTLRFEALAPPSLEAPGTPWLSGAQAVRLATVGGVILAALGVMAFVIRPLLAGTAAAPQAGEAEAEGQAALATPEAAAPPPAAAALAPPEAAAPPQVAGPEAPPSRAKLPAPEATLDDEAASAAADPVERLRTLISERRDETVEVLKGWIEEDAMAEETT